MKVRRPALFLLVLAFVPFAAAESKSPTFPEPGKTSMSKENQKALGMQVAAEVYKTMPVLPDDSQETQYVRRLGQKLVATIPEAYSWPFEFHVIPQKDINAFALPGGQMFVNIGTVTAARNEAELAGVMGHEMAHVYMQHSAKQASKSQTTGLLAGIATVILGEAVGDKAGGLVGELGRLGIQVGAQGLMMKYSRGDESQADAVGAVILYKAGYNPQGMVDFFKTMGASGGKAPPEFFSSHPAPANRQQALQTQIANWPAKDYLRDSDAFDDVRQHAAQIRAYSAEEIARGAKSGQWADMNRRGGASSSASAAANPRSRGASDADTAAPATGSSLDRVLPSSRMVAADLGPLKMKHPENWPVTLPQQKGQFVQIAPQAGVTPSGVGYGALLGGAGAAQGQQLGIEEMTSLLIQNLQGSQNLEPLGNSKPITVAGVEGRSTFLASASPFADGDGQARKERDWLVTIPRRDGGVIFMIFVAPETDFARLEPTYREMIRSVQLK
jgi:predicted Zn-dependent protease